MNIEKLEKHPHLVPEIAEMLQAQWSDLTRWSSASEIAERLARRNSGLNKEFTLLILADDGRVSGTVSVMLYELNDIQERQYWLGEVFTPLAYRGRGIATQLIKAGIEQCRQFGISHLYLYTPDQQALYRKLGWHEIEQRQVSGEQVSVMQLTLHP
ncbi:Predicted acetyltransferase [Yersinia frederiksenii]|uniref:Predicted acetyltransferase n=2 Tax=Yersinia frederiksenii TaxID=29484 RepID=A0A380PTW4_YERFR|nr:GNAT family N-acetyltransferase [Yersinia frederiksenii]ATM94457.1 N-acetyltransferase [Yersinia frederiksenii]EEQ13288.1 Histone acetyltransferase HPA2 and acetyltransferase [Yersinia frederiksenii ATCC 33641]KGA48677.1 acetyltransferase domain protein [Yersinia frederiksenii ATCC 33641]SUP77046.1 Predicted acetyltransferase [Yersinia frederiksenii]